VWQVLDYRQVDKAHGHEGLGVAEAVPSSDEQVHFLRNIQRVFAEGSFVASYKFALLQALVDLAVIKGDDSGAPLKLRSREIAEKFVELYWRQVRPFQVRGTPQGLILRQNTGRQAAVINRIAEAHKKSEGSLFQLTRDHSAWNKLVKDVDTTVCEMPLWKLQRVGKELLEFLYDNADEKTSVTITLKPGVAYCMRAYYGLLRDLIQGAWARFVRKVNSPDLGDVTDLGTFLFGQERSSLEQYRAILIEVQHGNCFYCHRALDKRKDVDHFIPWSRYPSDLGENFVLAHASCNAKKSDYLAYEEHLAAWQERNATHGKELAERLKQAGLPSDLNACVGIAFWAYSQTEQVGGQVWVRNNELRHLQPIWREYLVAG
jgi:hypothetical protein